MHTQPLSTYDVSPVLDPWEFFVVTAPLDANGNRWNDKLLLALLIDRKGRILHGCDPRQGFSIFDEPQVERKPGYLQIPIGYRDSIDTYRYTPTTGRLTPENPPPAKRRSQP